MSNTETFRCYEINKKRELTGETELNENDKNNYILLINAIIDRNVNEVSIM